MSTHGEHRRYFLNGASEELEVVRASEDTAAAAIHKRLAKLYRARAEALADEDEDEGRLLSRQRLRSTGFRSAQCPQLGRVRPPLVPFTKGALTFLSLERLSSS